MNKDRYEFVNCVEEEYKLIENIILSIIRCKKSIINMTGNVNENNSMIDLEYKQSLNNTKSTIDSSSDLENEESINNT